MRIAPHERRRITARLYRGEKVELHSGRVISPPTNASHSGGGGNYRWTVYDPPIRATGAGVSAATGRGSNSKTGPG